MAEVTKHDYTTKNDKQQFITWFIDKHGYNIHTDYNKYNSRTLSEEYQQDTNRLIPKITIHRWLMSIKDNGNADNADNTINTKHKKTTKQVITQCIDKYVSHYVAEQFTQV